jgi:hypothetical protein
MPRVGVALWDELVWSLSGDFFDRPEAQVFVRNCKDSRVGRCSGDVPSKAFSFLSNWITAEFFGFAVKCDLSKIDLTLESITPTNGKGANNLLICKAGRLQLRQDSLWDFEWTFTWGTRCSPSERIGWSALLRRGDRCNEANQGTQTKRISISRTSRKILKLNESLHWNRGKIIELLKAWLGVLKRKRKSVQKQT